MTAPDDQLVRMANQIAANLAASARDRAAQAVADHILMFWGPRMKLRVVALPRAGFNPIAAEAIDLVAERSSRPGAAVPASIPSGGGSDAG